MTVKFSGNFLRPVAPQKRPSPSTPKPKAEAHDPPLTRNSTSVATRASRPYLCPSVPGLPNCYRPGTTVCWPAFTTLTLTPAVALESVSTDGGPQILFKIRRSLPTRTSCDLCAGAETVCRVRTAGPRRCRRGRCVWRWEPAATPAPSVPTAARGGGAERAHRPFRGIGPQGSGPRDERRGVARTEGERGGRCGLDCCLRRLGPCLAEAAVSRPAGTASAAGTDTNGDPIVLVAKEGGGSEGPKMTK